ncbi:gamma-glutamyltransferase [Vibrio sp. kj40-1]|uniref:Gamma-glutamyltransferase n=1 Tax=Vibrio algarum TaxID=3020714 RepID=A0ABT4YR77_9VIBR|nr:gamma-glutamyltransferase [Vibrio sp. KJ40-1]
MSYRAAVTAPHYLASKAGEKILAKGGNAVEACIAMASTLTVVYPHMTSLGGDGFWLIHKPGETPIAINAAGQCAQDLSDAEFGKHQRGPKVALTTAGVVAGWDKALSVYAGSLSLNELFQSAIDNATNGFEVTQTLHDAQCKLIEEIDDEDFSSVFLKQSMAYKVGDTMVLPAMAKTYQKLAKSGLKDWYDGELAQENVRYLKKKGSPISLKDIANTTAQLTNPLHAVTQWGISTILVHLPKGALR